MPPDPSYLLAPARLSAIRDLELLQRGGDPTFELLTKLACRLMGVPVALVTVVGEAGQHFVGLSTRLEAWRNLTDTPLSHSFCRHVVETRAPLITEDARLHPSLADNPAIRELGAVAYAGLPLSTSSGEVLGTVCVIDSEPRQWNQEELELLAELNRLAVARIELLEESARRARDTARSRALVENLEEVITVLDGDATILFETASIERILGYTETELVGTSALDIVHPDERSEIQRALGGVLAEPVTPVSGEVRLRHKVGDWRTMEYVAKNLLDDPAIRGIVVNSRDVTEVRVLERMARQAEKFDALGRLSGGVAHDFNNVLAAILGTAQVGLLDLPDDSPLRTDLQAIIDCAQRGSRLTRQLLTFSREKAPGTHVLDVGRVVDGMTEMLERLLGRKSELKVTVDDAGPRVRMNESELEQLVMNLVVNAGDAMPEGGRVAIEVERTRAVPVDTFPVSQPIHDDYITLSVTDTGTGVPEELRSEIFEPLFTTKTEGEGTGLGLSTVYGVVARAGGRIGLKSVVGEGTTFSVHLPAWGESG